MEKHIESYFFNSKQLPKLVKFKLEMERLRKKRVFAKDSENTKENFEKSVTKPSKTKSLKNNKTKPLLLVEGQEEVKHFIEESNTALIVIEKPELEKVSDNKLLISQDIEKAPEVFAKSKEQRKKEEQKELSEQEQMRQFLKNFIKTVQEEKKQMAT